MVAYLLLLLGSQEINAQSEQFNPINDSTIARYRYDVDEQLYAQVPIGTNIDDIHLSEKDLLKPIHQKFTISHGVNAQSEGYYQIKARHVEHIEAWLSTPDLRIISPRGSYGFDSTGTVEYQVPHTAVERQNLEAEAQERANEGYFPVMPFFPNQKHKIVEELMNNGYSYSTYSHKAFKLSKADESYFFDPENKLIIHQYVLDSTVYEVETHYTLYAPYGYVPIFEKESSTRQDLATPVTFIQQNSFSNHVIEDLNGIIKKYTDESRIEIFPNPVGDDYEVALVGIPDAQIGIAQVRDHMGNIVYTHTNPLVEGDILSLNAQNYPSGVLILIITTQYGMYSASFTKS